MNTSQLHASPAPRPPAEPEPGPQPQDDACQTRCIHPERIEAVRRGMPAAAQTRTVAEIFKVLGDPTRVRLLGALLAAPATAGSPDPAGQAPGPGELCVCDLSALLGLSPSAVSHQLRVLRAARLVRHRKAGKLVFYALDDDHVTRLLAEALEHAGHAGPAAAQPDA